MSTPFLAEIKIVSFSFAPKGWAECDGQLLAISQNQALFALVGTMYGGDGQQTFALPDLKGRVPVHLGGSWVQGQKMGEEGHTLIQSELPSHVHLVQASSAAASTPVAPGNVLAATPTEAYAPSPVNAALAAGSVSSTGGSQPHANMQPYLVLNFVIALQGIFPSRN